MKPVFNLLCWSFVLTALVYLAVGPGVGVLHGNPLACLGVGMIGLGLCMDCRRRLVAVRIERDAAR